MLARCSARCSTAWARSRARLSSWRPPSGFLSARWCIDTDADTVTNGRAVLRRTHTVSATGLGSGGTAAGPDGAPLSLVRTQLVADAILLLGWGWNQTGTWHLACLLQLFHVEKRLS